MATLGRINTFLHSLGNVGMVLRSLNPVMTHRNGVTDFFQGSEYHTGGSLCTSFWEYRGRVLVLCTGSGIHVDALYTLFCRVVNYWGDLLLLDDRKGIHSK